MLATLYGAESLDRRLAHFPSLLRVQLDAKARALAATLVSRIRDEKLSGQVLATRSGALKVSISAELFNDGERLTASVGSTGDVKYAAIQEYGGRTAAHDILPDKGRALAFLVGGTPRFARRVHHPGSSLPARSYLLASLAEAGDDIIAALADTATEAWDKS